MNDKFLTVEEVSEKAGVHVESVRRWIRQGELPASLPSRYHGYQVREKDLEDFLGDKYKVKQKGTVEAIEVLKSLADLWDKTRHKGYLEVAYQVAELSGILKDFQKSWNDGPGNDHEYEEERLIEQRGIVNINLTKNLGEKTRTKEKNRLKKIEGELILRHFLKGDDYQ